MTARQPVSALPSVGARVAAFVAILLAGAAGGAIGYAFVDLQISGDSTWAAGGAAILGAIAAAAGTAVVVVLTLRAMGEWQTIRAADPDAVDGRRREPARGRSPRRSTRVR